MNDKTTGSPEEWSVKFERVRKCYRAPDGSIVTALHLINLAIRPGEFVSIVGGSGSGKSTLLKQALGNEHPTSGRVLINGVEVERVDQSKGYVDQTYEVVEHLSVLDNIALGLLARKTNLFQRFLSLPAFRRAREEAREQVLAILPEFGLDSTVAHRFPHQLSGGMRQRVAIAQELITGPNVLFMDEATSALDARRKLDVGMFVLDIWEARRPTVFWVTHNLEEACFLGSRLIVLSRNWSDNQGNPGKGGTIIWDIPTPGGHPKPLTIRKAPEFRELIDKLESKVLTDDVRHRVADFNLRHQDAWKPEEHREALDGAMEEHNG